MERPLDGIKQLLNVLSFCYFHSSQNTFFFYFMKPELSPFPQN